MHPSIPLLLAAILVLGITQAASLLRSKFVTRFPHALLLASASRRVYHRNSSASRRLRLSGSVIRDPPKRREDQIASTKALEKVASDVTSTSTTIEGSGDIGTGRVGYITTSDPGYVGYRGLRRAIDEGRLDIAVELSKQDKELGEAGVGYVSRKDNPDLIASFVNQTHQANATTLEVLWRNSPIETVERVLNQVDFPQQVFVDVALSYTVTSRAETFLVFLNKLLKPKDQEKAVEKGIEQLANNVIATSSLLNALKGKTFRSERLEYFATQKAFMEGVKSGIVNHLSEDICKHAAITPELYADGLIVTAEYWKHDPMRQSSLKQADRYDLEAVRKKAGYADLDAEFHADIEEALKIAASGGTRNQDIERMEKIEETSEELESPRTPPKVVDPISASALADSQTPSRKAKIAAKKVASDVPSTLPKIEGSGDIGSERVGEDQA